MAEPRLGGDGVIGTLYEDHFTVEPGHPEKRVTRTRVAAHTLYENPSPYHLKEPTGLVDTTHADFEQLDDRTVKVTGSRFEPGNRYTVKLEGVKALGYRTVSMAGTRDPILIGQIDKYVEDCKSRATFEVGQLDIDPSTFRINVHVYGKNATMGAIEPVQETAAHELGLLVDVIGDTEEISKAVCAKMRYILLHGDFEGRMCISGNMAIPFSPSDMPVGPVYEFSVWHVMECDHPLEAVRMEMEAL